MKRPDFLHKGDTIAIVAPSFGVTTEPYKTKFEVALTKLRSRGYNVVTAPCCYKSDGLGISTDPVTAARELEEYYLDPSIQALFSAGGGELMCETVGNIDFNKLKDAPPKWFMGYSDNTNFILPLTTLCHTQSLYGICAPTLGQEWDRSLTDHMELLEGRINKVSGYDKYEAPDSPAENPLDQYNMTQPKILTYFNHDRTAPLEVTGTLMGGCLDVLNNLAGTSLEDVRGFNQSTEDVIWILESCDYNTMDIRRALWHLDKCEWFTKARAFIIGRPLAAFNQQYMGLDQYRAVTDILGKYRVPIIMDADVGHIDPIIPVIMGSTATIRSQDNEWSIEYLF